MEVADWQRDFIHGQCLQNLLSSRVPEEGWFIAAPGYSPYGNYVWFRDNAECAMALDEYSATFGETRFFGITANALLRAFHYFESKKDGVDKLSGMRNKVMNPEFYNSSYHPHARVSQNGETIAGPWNNIQYDSVARSVIALTKHLALTRDKSTFARCEAGLRVAMKYLFDSIWDQSSNRKMLTVCANEWEEKEEAHLRNPLFSSVVGLLYAASRDCSMLEEYMSLKEINLAEYQRETESMLKAFFLRDGELKMIKRFEEPPTGTCSTSLWLLTTYGVFPTNGEVFEKTLNMIAGSRYLSVDLDPKDMRGNKSKGVRRYEVGTGSNGHAEFSPFVDHYWGGQAWIITTAQLATGLAMKGDLERAHDLFTSCLQTRNREGTLPEQFDGTYFDASSYAKWKEWSHASAPAPWLAWSHAEVIRAYTVIHKSN